MFVNGFARADNSGQQTLKKGNKRAEMEREKRALALQEKQKKKEEFFAAKKEAYQADIRKSNAFVSMMERQERK